MRSARSLMMAVVMAMLSGCAALTPVEGPPIGGLMPASGAVRDSAAAGTVPVPGAMPVRLVPADSTPSAEAREVLAAIPEPLPPGERVPPPARPDTASTAPSDADVPAPEPTRPMGDTGVRTPPPIESSPPAASPGAPGAPPIDTPARPDTCWRLQVGAPETAEEAEQKRSAAESLLMSGFVVEKDGALYKVRTRECVSRSAALRLRDRAIESGFAGAFPIAIVRR